MERGAPEEDRWGRPGEGVGSISGLGLYYVHLGLPFSLGSHCMPTASGSRLLLGRQAASTGIWLTRNQTPAIMTTVLMRSGYEPLHTLSI